MTQYLIEVQTGNRENAGTDARVYIQLIGAKAKSGEIRLDNKQDNFEKGKLDRFRVDVDDVGWIDSIRIFHDNANNKPGWYLDWVKVTHVGLGLTFKVDFYRWLATNEGDKSIDVTYPVPVTNVALSRGQIVSYFIGYDFKRKSHGGPGRSSFKETFSCAHKQGATLKKGNSWTVSASAKIGAEFWGLKCEFTTGVTRQILTEMSTTEEQTITTSSEMQFELEPGQSMTAIAFYYQKVLEGEASASGVRMQFEDQFTTINADMLTFDRVLTDQEIEQVVAQHVKAMGGAAAVLPARIPKQGARVALGVWPVAGALKAATVNPVLRTLPTTWLRPGALLAHAKLRPNIVMR